MKKLLALLLVTVLALASLTACSVDDVKSKLSNNFKENVNTIKGWFGIEVEDDCDDGCNNDGNNDTNNDANTGNNNDNNDNNNDNNDTEGVTTMTYAEYVAAKVDDQVVIEAYVQAHQSWWDNKVTVYLADYDGAYFAYEMACSEADAAKLTPGTKIKVTGYKAVWEGEVEIVDATFTFVEGADSYIAYAKDLTNVLGTDDLITYQNQLAAFKGLTVKKVEYKNGAPGDDIYVTLTKGESDFSFCVERYLTGPETEVYKAFENIKAGDVVDVQGFVYWYAGVNTHITKISVSKPIHIMNYEEYVAAEVDEEVIIEAYVQANQSWWNDQITVYLADKDGAYFVYNMACSEADAAKLTPGTKIRVTGYKAVWEGEVEIADATFEIVYGADKYVAPAKNLTDVLGTDNLINYQNQLALFKKLTVKSIEYKNGTPGDDIYVTLTKGDKDFSFCVERYLTGPETAVYKAFEDLEAGDVVNVEGFLYWYGNVNTHITKIEKYVLSYAEYVAAEEDTEVIIEGYVQANQSWWDNKISVYLADADGAYFVYNMACSEADAAKLTPGTKIKVTGYKTSWEGEIEVADATFTFVEGAEPYIATAKDLTELLGTDELINYQNQLAVFKRLTVKSIRYKGGAVGNDIYVTVEKDGVEFNFCVESYLTGPETELYKAFETLPVGEVIDIEGFVYWYAGVNTHITKISAAAMSYAEYEAAEVDTEVIIEAYVQAHQSWWDNKITVYLADKDGAYFVYNMACSEADAAKLTPGTKIRVTGYKAVWEGEIEVVDATFTFVEGTTPYIAPAKDLTEVLGTDELINYQNQLAAFKGVTIKSIRYKGGAVGNDIYVTVEKNGAEFDFCVESYLTGPETELYKAFETLAAGDVVDIEGFVYWYGNVNTHITKITKVA